MSREAPIETTPVAPLEGEALEKALASQLQWYFSAENLLKDQYLVRQMDANGNVKVSVIAGFGRVKSLTNDQDIILRIMRQCQSLVVDETGLLVRSAVPISQSSQRTTLILRNIPSDLPESEVKALFNFPGCPTPVSLKPEYGNTWFINFINQSETEVAHVALLNGRTYNDKPISCSIKSVVVKPMNYFVFQNPRQGSPFNQNQYGGYQTRSAPPVGSGDIAPNTPRQKKAFEGSGSSPILHSDKKRQRNGLSGVGAKSSNGVDMKKGVRHDKTGGVKTARKGKRQDGDKKEPSFGTADFPALPSSARKADREGSSVKFSREDMTRIIQNFISVGDMSRPSTMPAAVPNGFTRESPAQSTQLNDNFPVFFPASPSPELAAQAVSSADIPFLDLDFMPTIDQPLTVDQASVAAAVASAQGIDIPAVESSHSRRSSKPLNTPAANATESVASYPVDGKQPESAPTDGDGDFKTYQSRKSRGGHGAHSGPRAGGHGGGERPPRTGDGRTGGGHGDRTSRGGRGGERAAGEHRLRSNNNPRADGDTDRRPRNQKPIERSPKTKTSQTAPLSAEPKKTSFADILNQVSDPAKVAQVLASKASVPTPAPVTVAATTPEASSEQKSTGNNRQPRAKGEKRDGGKRDGKRESGRAPRNQQTEDAAPLSPPTEVGSTKPSFAELLKPKAGPAVSSPPTSAST